MIESIFLDILLVLIVVLMMAIGAYRGGMREALSAAGVVLGVLLALEWSTPWGGWIGDNTNLSDGGGQFMVSVALLVLATLSVGYGVGASFNYHPGPGGRMFGAALGAGSAVIAISYVMTWVRLYLFDGDETQVLQDTYIARFLDGDAGLALLLVSGVIIVGALFGSLVRERDDDDAESSQMPTVSIPRPARRVESTVPDKVEPPRDSHQPTSPIQVRPGRQWEDRAGSMPQLADRQWSNTWPSDAPGMPEEDRPVRSGQVQQARNRRRNQGDDGGQGEKPRR